MSYIVVLESYRTHDVEGSADRPDFKLALIQLDFFTIYEAKIKSWSTYIFYQISHRDIEVVPLYAEVKVSWEAFIAPFQTPCPIICLVHVLGSTVLNGVGFVGFCEEFFHKTIEPKFGDHDVRGTCVENCVQASFTISPSA